MKGSVSPNIAHANYSSAEDFFFSTLNANIGDVYNIALGLYPPLSLSLSLPPSLPLSSHSEAKTKLGILQKQCKTLSQTLKHSVMENEKVNINYTELMYLVSTR